MRLRAKLLLPLLLAYALSLALIHLFWLPNSLAQAREAFMQAQAAVLRTLEPDLARSLLVGDLGAIYGSLDRQMELQQGNWISLELLNPTGKLLYPLAPPDLAGAGTPLHHRITWEQHTLAEIRLRLDWARREVTLLHDLHLLELMILLVFGGVIAGAALWQQRLVRRPILHLSAASARLAGGDFAVELPPRGRDEIGELSRAFEHMRDSLMQAQRELEQSRAAYGRLLESAGEGIFGIDVEGRLSFINRAGAQMLGYRPEQLLGGPPMPSCIIPAPTPGHIRNRIAPCATRVWRARRSRASRSFCGAATGPPWRWNIPVSPFSTGRHWQAPSWCFTISASASGPRPS
jgi:PAS domain-containing protein